MIIRWIGQGGYVIKSGETEIMVDPYLSDIVGTLHGMHRLYPAPFLPESVSANAVICTHDHLDHLDPEAVSKMSDEQFFITTNEGIKHLEELGKKNYKAVNTGDKIKVGNFEIRVVYAKHSCEAFGLIIEAEGECIYISGDTLFDEKLFEVRNFRPDVMFICINGRLGNMNVDEAVTVAKQIGAKKAVPNHYDMFASNSEDPEKFTDELNNGFIMERNKDYPINEII
ncbi:MAG: MBL fold metallo-hydrolase [Clostridia bacterium]|nr:MBL fold metallo-hydrolase [Clostridia bacterium]